MDEAVEYTKSFGEKEERGKSARQRLEGTCRYRVGADGKHKVDTIREKLRTWKAKEFFF